MFQKATHFTVISEAVDAWVYLSLICAFALATSDALTKKALAESDEYLVAWFRLLFALPVLLLFREKNIKKRLTGAMLMFTGFVVIVTA